MEQTKRTSRAEKAASSSATHSPVIVIVGQTASGKSALAMLVAQQFNGEIICADSRTIYKGMDIGTAKPSAQDRRLIPHHGLDLIEPSETFSAAAFQAYAREKVADVQARDKLPIIVGGTGLYIDSLVYDFSFAGKADAALRAKYEAMSLDDLQVEAHSLGLNEADIDFKNRRHFSRILERMSLNPNAKMRPDRKLKPDNILLLGIQIDREQLIDRIHKRVDTMFAEGLVDEIQNLISVYGDAAPGLLAAGYRDVVRYLSGAISLDEAKVLFIRSHKYLAKRQQTWFKRNQDIIWVQSKDEALEKITKFTQVWYNINMIEQLFGSKTRVKLLQLFYSNPNRSFYVREITRKIDEQINSVRRELSNLLNAGIISSETTNNRLYYEINKSYKFYDPLSQIFGASAGVTADEDTSESTAALKAIGNVNLALYTGQFTRDEKSGVDFLVVGDINHTQLAKYIADLETKEGKAIRYAVMDKKEFEYRRQINDRFLLTVLDAKKQIIIDRDDLLADEHSEPETEAVAEDTSLAVADKKEVSSAVKTKGKK